MYKKSLLKNLLLHQDNTTPYFGQEAKGFYKEERIKLLKHPLYSPDLSLCDFWLFPKIKNCLKDKRFNTRDGVLETFF